MSQITISNSAGSVLMSGSTGLSLSSGVNKVISVNSDLIEFTELLFAVLGYDITFEEFSKMTKEQRKSILRDIKINRVLKED